jgi:hypothetical protein
VIAVQEFRYGCRADMLDVNGYRKKTPKIPAKHSGVRQLASFFV